MLMSVDGVEDLIKMPCVIEKVAPVKAESVFDEVQTANDVKTPEDQEDTQSVISEIIEVPSKSLSQTEEILDDQPNASAPNLLLNDNDDGPDDCCSIASIASIDKPVDPIGQVQGLLLEIERQASPTPSAVSNLSAKSKRSKKKAAVKKWKNKRKSFNQKFVFE